jgi:hypothetical protein
MAATKSTKNFNKGQFIGTYKKPTTESTKKYIVLGKKMTQDQYNELVEKNFKSMTKEEFDDWIFKQLDEANPDFVKKAQKKLSRSFKKIRK